VEDELLGLVEQEQLLPQIMGERERRREGGERGRGREEENE
jgi:hypothetical protein